MRVQLSVRERIAVYAALCQRQSSGAGDPITRLWEDAQLEGAGKFVVNGMSVDGLPDDPEPFEVTPDGFDLILGALCAPLPLALARVATRCFGRLRRL